MPKTRAKPAKAAKKTVKGKVIKKVAKKKPARGASKGGLARAKNLSPRRRKQIARKAALARWAKAKTRVKRIKKRG